MPNPCDDQPYIPLPRLGDPSHMPKPEKTFSEILRLVWEQTQAMKEPLTSVKEVERRAKRIDELAKRIAGHNSSDSASYGPANRHF